MTHEHALLLRKTILVVTCMAQYLNDLRGLAVGCDEGGLGGPAYMGSKPGGAHVSSFFVTLCEN